MTTTTPSRILSSIGDHVLEFSEAQSTRGTHILNRSYTLQELAALRNNPAVMDSFAQMDADLECIDHIQSSLEEARCRLQMKRARMESALAAINVLPPEIIRMILLEVPSSSKDDSNSVLAVSQVCSSWRSFALELSGLWTNINIAWSVPQQRIWLNRTRRRPLDIYWTLPRSSPASVLRSSRASAGNTSVSDRPPEALPPVEDVLLSAPPRARLTQTILSEQASRRRHVREYEHDGNPLYPWNPYAGPCSELWAVAGRWRSFCLSCTSEPFMRRMLKTLQNCPDLGVLTTISLDASPSALEASNRDLVGAVLRQGVKLEFDKFASPLPSLRNVCLSRVRITTPPPPLSSRDDSYLPDHPVFAPQTKHPLYRSIRLTITTILSNLCSLRLTDIDAHVDEWADLLRPCTSLRLLIISNGQVAQPRALPKNQRVVLPVLETLSLEDTSAPTMRFAAHSLDMPALRTLHLDFPNDQFDHPMFFRPAARCLDALFSNCTTVTTLQVARESWVQPVISALSRDRIPFSPFNYADVQQDILDDPPPLSLSNSELPSPQTPQSFDHTNLPTEMDPFLLEQASIIATAHRLLTGSERPNSTVSAMLQARFDAEPSLSGASTSASESHSGGIASGGESGEDEQDPESGSITAATSSTSSTSSSAGTSSRRLTAGRSRYLLSPPPEHTLAQPRGMLKSMIPSIPADAHPDTCLLPELRILRLNTRWCHEIRDLVSYRLRLAQARRRQLSGKDDTDSQPTDSSPFNSHTSTNLLAFHTLGMMEGPIDVEISNAGSGVDMEGSATWLKAGVGKLELNPAGWRRWDDHLAF